MEDFEEWLSESFTTLQIDPVFTEYISGILQDEEISLSDRIETVLQVLSSATEEDLKAFEDELKDQWNNVSIRQTEENLLAKVAQENKERLHFETEQAVTNAAQKIRAEAKLEKKNLSAEQVQMRERILDAYAYSDGEQEEGNVGNANKARVQDHQKNLRDVAKESHVQKVNKDKVDLALDKERKINRKKKTVKREKTRGGG